MCLKMMLLQFDEEREEAEEDDGVDHLDNLNLDELHELEVNIVVFLLSEDSH